jgi:uncharacterized SAM-binding protein YcdF (DUF218 family)
VEYYPRLMQAAALVGQGYADRIVINGNRKSDALRELEAKGYVPAVPWYENYLRILEVLEVSREKVITVSLEDVYDTRTEAAGVIEALRAQDIRRILLVTSRYHTARAAFIWRREAGGRLQITPVAARQDPFDPGGWWEDGRQIRWLLNEYGGWLFYLWQTLWPEGRDAHSRAPAD